jgi:hypothetical protein
MTINEAIRHAEDVAKSCDTDCGREHHQLAGWLNELCAKRKTLARVQRYAKAMVDATHKCNSCHLKGKSFRSEPCFWHCDCGLGRYEHEMHDHGVDLMRVLKGADLGATILEFRKEEAEDDEAEEE